MRIDPGFFGGGDRSLNGSSMIVTDTQWRLGHHDEQNATGSLSFHFARAFSAGTILNYLT